MNRRDFVATGLSSLLTCTCGYARRASAKAVSRGCRLAAAGDDEKSVLRSLLRAASHPRQQPAASSRQQVHDLFSPNLSADPRDFEAGTNKTEEQFASDLSNYFGVQPGFSFYNDFDGMNAMAVADSLLPDQGSDGTVLFGIHLYQRLISGNWYEPPKPVSAHEILGVPSTPTTRTTRKRRPPDRDPAMLDHPPLGNSGIDIVMAHEFGHILQFKERVEDSWAVEPHADFMAGWAIAQVLKRGKPQRFGENREAELIETSVHEMFSMGDTKFTNSDHHGEPLFRAVMVRAGYEFGYLGVKAAFDKGMSWLDLKRS